ncbi:MAG: oligopeptidase B, partial [Microbacterium sp.]|nr:oligopeptidase B [Microbacterium sp.]
MTDAPIAARRPSVRTHHGDAFEDPYEWMREKDSPEVVSHLEAENAYTDARTAHLAPLRERIFQEIKGRVQETDLSVPTRRGDWWYFSRTEEGSQYAIHCRTAAGDDWTPPVLEPGAPVPGEVVLLDGNVEAEGHEFFSLGAFDTTDDATKLLWSTDFEGDELYTVRVRDLVTGETLPDEIPNTGGAFFTPDGTGVLYTTRDDAWRPDTLW